MALRLSCRLSFTSRPTILAALSGCLSNAVFFTQLPSCQQNSRALVCERPARRHASRRRLSIVAARRGFLSEIKDLKEEKNVAGPIKFESPLSVVLYPHPVLRHKNMRVNVFDESLEQLVKEMFEVMYRTDGVGLSAPQVGVNVRLMVYNPMGEQGKGEEYVLVNPRIIKYAKAKDVMEEGCLSFPKIYADVERSVGVKVEAQDLKGKKFSLSLKGWQARIFQHEYDHLERVLFIDRMETDILDTIKSPLLELEEQYSTSVGAPTPETVAAKLMSSPTAV